MLVNISEIQPFDTKDISENIILDMLETVRDKGLLHPVTLRPITSEFTLGESETKPQYKYKVIAGRKRILAFQKLERTEIDALILEVSDNEAIEISIHENLRRKNLSWYEEAELVAKLHEMRQTEHGGKEGRGRPKAGEKVWGVRDTADELGKALGEVSEDINLAKAVRRDPSLRNIKDKQTAVKLVRQSARRIKDEEEQTITSSLLDIDPNQLFLGSSHEILRKLPANIFNACITDPPWLKFRDVRLIADDETYPTFSEIYRVLKPDSFLYLFVGVDDFMFYTRNLPKLGFKVAKTPLIWHKLGFQTRHGVASWEYNRDLEFIIVAVKGTPVRTSASQRSAVMAFKPVHPVHLIHPNEKPGELIRELLLDCSYENAFVLDPFAGSGVVGEVCTKMSRKYILIERDKTANDKIKERLKIK